MLGKKLSHSQIKMLESTKTSGDPYARIFGMAAAGGAFKTYNSLRYKYRLITSTGGRKHKLTPAGIASLKSGRLPVLT